MDLPPLPIGWSVERTNAVLDAADFSAFSSLTPDDVQLIITYMTALDRPANEAATADQAAQNAEEDAQRAAANQESRAEQAERLIREKQSLLNHYSLEDDGLLDVAREMWDNGYEVWGFVVFRTALYGEGEEERWAMYKQKLNQFFDKALKDNGARLGEGLALQWTLHWVEEGFDGASIEAVREEFARLVEEEEIPEGFEQDLCLVADARAVDSLLNGGPTRRTHLSAVCRQEPKDRYALDEGEEPDSDGHFKVALEAVLPTLSVMLNGMDAMELEPGAGYLWNGVFDAIADV